MFMASLRRSHRMFRGLLVLAGLLLTSSALGGPLSEGPESLGVGDWIDKAKKGAKKGVDKAKEGIDKGKREAEKGRERGKREAEKGKAEGRKGARKVKDGAK